MLTVYVVYLDNDAVFIIIERIFFKMRTQLIVPSAKAFQDVWSRDSHSNKNRVLNVNLP